MLFRLPSEEELTDNKLNEFLAKHDAECAFRFPALNIPPVLLLLAYARVCTPVLCAPYTPYTYFYYLFLSSYIKYGNIGNIL